ncbi:MAG: hypothetical protein ACOX2B_10430 [Syntrophothermaceae bacterium]
MDKLGASRLEKLRAIPPYGYVPRSKGGDVVMADRYAQPGEYTPTEAMVIYAARF